MGPQQRIAEVLGDVRRGAQRRREGPRVSPKPAAPEAQRQVESLAKTRVFLSGIHWVQVLHLHFGEPKSRRSKRWVDMPRFVADMLGGHIGADVSDDDGLIFTSPRGAPLRHSNFYKTVWRPAVRQAELPDALRIHDLRHTAASFMIFEGAHIELVRKQLGHSSVIVTQRYAHLYPSQGEDLAVRLDRRRQSTIDTAVGL